MLVIVFIVLAISCFVYMSVTSPNAGKGTADEDLWAESHSKRDYGLVQKMKEAQKKMQPCCTTTKSACPTKAGDDACNIGGYVRPNANGCHCGSDDDFRKCFSASCNAPCPGAGEQVKLNHHDVPDFDQMEKLHLDGKLEDYSCQNIAAWIKGHKQSGDAAADKPKEEPKQEKVVDRSHEEEDPECCQSEVRGCPTSGPTACSVGGWVRGAANGCYCPDELGPDEFRKCFAASCANSCPGSPNVTIDFRLVPQYEEMEMLIEAGKLGGVSCQHVAELKGYAPNHTMSDLIDPINIKKGNGGR